jgi:hypothetical protein
MLLSDHYKGSKDVNNNTLCDAQKRFAMYITRSDGILRYTSPVICEFRMTALTKSTSRMQAVKSNKKYRYLLHLTLFFTCFDY